jgi:DNA-binding CsgD family transcriptional regulator
MLMPEHIAGRDAELEAVGDFLAQISQGAAAHVLEGEAGMGKTTLWRAAIEQAEVAGVLVLQAQPVESETTLSYAGIGDLLEPVLDVTLEALPAVQRRALSRALVLGEEDDVPLDPRALRVALMTVLRTLAEDRRVLVAIDDSQWLDFASSAALAYGVRRFRAERIGLLLSRRAGLESVLLDELLRSPAGERFTRIHVGALDVRALGRVVHEHLGTSLPRPLLAEVHAASGGNPFYALEIVRMLRRTGVSIEAGQPVPLPESLHDLVHGRVVALPSESRDFLLAAAAHAHPTIAITEAASGVARGDGLEPALAARVVELDGERIRFTHPLLAAGVYEAASPLRRLEVHRRLAELLDDPEARAWQLAASVGQPAETVAAVLEEASAHARSRGALRHAALLLERARELTPLDHSADAVRRAVEAAYLHFESGDSPRAEARLQEVIDRLPPGVDRARALMRFARVRSYETQDRAVDLFLQAIDEAEGDREILAVAHEGVAACLFRLRERLDEAVDHAELAAALALELGDEALAAEALGSRLLPETLLGRETAAETADRALALQDVAKSQRVMAQPLSMVAVRWWWTDLLGQAHAALSDMLERSRDLGDESSVPYVLVILGQVECSLCNFGSALGRALEGQAAAEQSGQHTLHAYHLALEALVESQRGQIDRARAAALSALECVPDTGGRPAELLAVRALGHLELALGAPGAALARLGPSVAFVRREAIAEPGAIPFVVDQIEALIELGMREEGGDLLDWYGDNARRLERASALANCARCRGMLAAQAGDLAAALAAYEEALEWHAKVELPLDRGRTLLVLGATQRRLKRRRDARRTLEEALAVFERIGAALWADRARGELKRISGRAATPGALTPAEERVAALVAEGKTNREVAAALFLSDRTVEGHLSHVFRKLGIRHRAEVRPALASRHAHESDAPNTGESPVSAETIAP